MKTALAQEKAPQLRIVARGNAPDPNEIRILVVDGHELFVEGIRTLIRSESGMTIIGHAAHRTAALEAAAMKPHVILLELVLQDQGTLDFLPDLLRIAEGARVLVVTGETDSELQVRAMRLGAMGVLLKSEPSSTLFKAIRKIHNGEAWLRRSLVSTVMSGFSRADAGRPKDPNALEIATLTPREFDVVALIGEGLRNKQIGERLFITETTVRHYLTTIFDKLAVADRLELIIYAYQHGLARI